jgi:flagellar motility protein MotE (MotC chaperone)
MSWLIHKIRLVPVVLFAAAGLFTLKLSGLLIDGGYTLGAGHQAKTDRAVIEAHVLNRPLQAAQQQPAPARQRSWAQDMFGYPDITGSVGASKPAPPKEGAAPPATAEKPVDPKYAKPPPKAQSGTVVQLDAQHVSPAERALLERLAERRQELEKRQSELDMRDTLLRAAEKRLEQRINELKEAEERIVAATARKEEAEIQRLKNLVTMYENMKAKDAAKIFDRLDINLATEVAKLIPPRRMSDIMAQMSPDAAQKLTVELAARSRENGQPKPPELPKIEGRPNGT